jgi:DNA-binding IclR family transcriptional regulator
MSRRTQESSTVSDVGEDVDRSATKSLRKALSILDVVSVQEYPSSIAEVAMRTGISRPTAYRLVQTLVVEGYLVQDPIDGRLLIGLAVLPLAANVLDSNRMRLEALPHLHALAQRTGERVNLGILYRTQVLYIAGAEKPSLPMIYSQFGKSAPAHCCSLGKSILAYLPKAEVHAVITATGLFAQTPKSITSMPRFLAELAETRKRRYAVDREEHIPGSFCVATTIFNQRHHPVGAIGLSGHAIEPLLSEVDTLRHTAEVISHVL